MYDQLSWACVIFSASPSHQYRVVMLDNPLPPPPCIILVVRQHYRAPFDVVTRQKITRAQLSLPVLLDNVGEAYPPVDGSCDLLL